MQDKLALLDKYLTTTSDDDFDQISEKVIFWVDWREEDDAIVEYCEARLQTGQLSATLEDKDEGLELQITFKDSVHSDAVVDRDRTLIFLNSVIRPAYEIRFCKASDGSDTLAFLPLSAAEWKTLETKYGIETVDKCFERINAGSVIFK